MDEIVTEKATSRWDLPHGYIPAGDAGDPCYCGRRESNTLHLPVTQLAEHASAGARLQTEKGS